MQQFSVSDDLVVLVWKRARPKPFENLTFDAALRRTFQSLGLTSAELEEAHSESEAADALGARMESKKAPTPSASEWAASVPDLRGKKGLSSWKHICDILKIDTGGDSARRKLKNWVKANRPTWPAVPEPE
jgi:hypothetical protein